MKKKKIVKKIKRKPTKPLMEEQDIGRVLLGKKQIIRTPVLDLKHKVYINPEAYKILRAQKTKLEKSMAQIVCDLIIETYGEKK